MRGKARERYTEISNILDQSDDLQITSAFCTCTCTNVSIYVPVVGCLFCMVTFGFFFYSYGTFYSAPKKSSGAFRRENCFFIMLRVN